MPDTFLASSAGFRLGLRPPHYQELLRPDVPVDFVEVISEDFMVKKGGGTSFGTIRSAITARVEPSKTPEVAGTLLVSWPQVGLIIAVENPPSLMAQAAPR
jgi:hypothetical protein